MTTRRRHTPEQVVRKLTQADRLLAEGKDVADVCRELGVSEQTYYRWRNQFGGLNAGDAKRKGLERGNSAMVSRGWLRDECLNIKLFWSMAHARVVIADWKTEYNHHRRHSEASWVSCRSFLGRKDEVCRRRSIPS